MAHRRRTTPRRNPRLLVRPQGLPRSYPCRMGRTPPLVVGLPPRLLSPALSPSHTPLTRHSHPLHLSDPYTPHARVRWMHTTLASSVANRLATPPVHRPDHTNITVTSLWSVRMSHSHCLNNSTARPNSTQPLPRTDSLPPFSVITFQILLVASDPTRVATRLCRGCLQLLAFPGILYSDCTTLPLHPITHKSCSRPHVPSHPTLTPH